MKPSLPNELTFADSRQTKSNDVSIVSARSVEDDFERVGNKLSAYTSERKAPAYNPLSQTFRASSATGEILGESIITQNWGKLEVDMLHVEPSHRGKGIGRLLMSAVEDFARVNGLTAIRLNSPTWQGVGFYERLGFSEMGRIPLSLDDTGIPQAEVTYAKILV